MASPDRDRIVRVEGREVKLTHLAKVLYPSTGTTKAELIKYYATVAPVLLPHLAERLVTLKRYPDGVEGDSFFEKSCPSNRPEWISTAGRYAKTRGRITEYCLVDDAATLVWLANLATIEFHVPLAFHESPENPRTIVFDLDPGDGATLTECVEVALIVRDRLALDGLESLVKVSGSKGIQLYVPLNNPEIEFAQTKSYARALAEELASEHPRMIVSNMRKSLRKERVLIDWSQNDDAKTTVCVYSLRGRNSPKVSMPVDWSEVETASRRGSTSELVFPIESAMARIARRGDEFKPALELRQQLPTVKQQSRSRASRRPAAAAR